MQYITYGCSVQKLHHLHTPTSHPTSLCRLKYSEHTETSLEKQPTALSSALTGLLMIIG